MASAKTTLLDNTSSNGHSYYTIPQIKSASSNCNISLSPSDWNSHNWTIRDTALSVHGDTEFKGNIIVKGVNLTDTLNAIESRLGILRPNHKIEEEWQELKELGDRYRALEQEINRKMEVWDLLKREE